MYGVSAAVCKGECFTRKTYFKNHVAADNQKQTLWYSH